MLLKPWFIAFLFIFLTHQILQKGLGINIQFIDSYLDPLLFLPILLHLVLWERRVLFGLDSLHVLSWQGILTITALVSVLAEYFFPLWSANFTRDYWDVLCYFIGGVFFGAFLNRPFLK